MQPVLRWAAPARVADDHFLSDGERMRGAALAPHSARQAFVAKRWYIREVVAEASGCSPINVTIEQRCRRCGGPHGRPTVRTPSRRVPYVSWSSARGLTIVAVADVPVGVDVVPGPELREWARLEAVLKATGHGLDVDPSLVELSPTGVRRWHGPGARPRLRIHDLSLGDGLVGAVAHGRGGPIRARAGALVRRARA